MERLYIVEAYRDPFCPNSITEAVRMSNLQYKLIRRGKVKDLYEKDGSLILFHSDRISAFDNVFKQLIPYKGIYLNLLSAYWFEKTKSIFPNHFIELIDDRTMRVIKAERIDVEWIVRGYIYGSAWRAYSKGKRIISGVKLPSGLIMGEKLPDPILTPTLKVDRGHDVEIDKNYAIDKGLLTREEWSEIEEACIKLYNFYSSVADKVELIIADVKLEFGRCKDGLIQIDEPPTHDSARIWCKKYYRPGCSQEDHCLDKEFFRSYLRYIGFKENSEIQKIPFKVIAQVAWRVRGAYEVLSSKRSINEIPLLGLKELMEDE